MKYETNLTLDDTEEVFGRHTGAFVPHFSEPIRSLQSALSANFAALMTTSKPIEITLAPEKPKAELPREPVEPIKSQQDGDKLIREVCRSVLGLKPA